MIKHSFASEFLQITFTEIKILQLKKIEKRWFRSMLKMQKRLQYQLHESLSIYSTTRNIELNTKRDYTLGMTCKASSKMYILQHWHIKYLKFSWRWSTSETWKHISMMRSTFLQTTILTNRLTAFSLRGERRQQPSYILKFCFCCSKHFINWSKRSLYNIDIWRKHSPI